VNPVTHVSAQVSHDEAAHLANGRYDAVPDRMGHGLWLPVCGQDGHRSLRANREQLLQDPRGEAYLLPRCEAHLLRGKRTAADLLRES
jgi:hypothetical protein